MASAMQAVKRDKTGNVDQPPIKCEQHLTFLLAGEMFAIEILAVKEIIEYGQVTAVPMMPECIRGVINLRGSVVPVLDLSSRFGRGETAITRRSCIVIIEARREGECQDVGLVVDAVSEVLEIRADQIEPAPTFGAQIKTDFIAGMGKLDSGFVIILAVDRVLALDDLALAAEQAMEDGGVAAPAPAMAQAAA